jgi:tetratricopeptide (TPR) repeat protein
VRGPCRQALAYLWKTGNATVMPGGHADSLHPSDLLARDDALPPPEAERTEDDGDGDSVSELEPAECADAVMDMIMQGRLEMEQGEWEGAIRAFSLAIESDPEDGEIYQCRSLAYLELGRSDDALADAEAAVRLDPENSENYLARGMALLQARHFARAITDLTRYVKEEDVRACDGRRPSKGYYFRGLAYAGKGEMRRAIGDYTTAIHRWPNWPEPFLARAAAYEHLGDSRRAGADRAKAAEKGKD